MFLKGLGITRAIDKVIRENSGKKPLRIAVAFWGFGTETWLRGESTVICDLESGACNPEPIRALSMREDCGVFKCAGLHAKVVIGSRGAVISSANMSANGLGLGLSKPGTLEAGYFVEAGSAAYMDAEAWFDEILASASQVTVQDIARARERWRIRPKNTAGINGEPNIDPSVLLKAAIRSEHRIRAVRKDVLSFAETVHPQLYSGHLGKVSAWAVHYLLNRTENVLRFRGTLDEPEGYATDEWLSSRLLKGDDALVEALLVAMARAGNIFDPNVRYAAQLVLNAKPWC